MQRTWSAIGSAIGLASLFAAGCAGPGFKPAFEWDPTYASPGKSLKLEELYRETTPEGTQVFYRIEATGFTDAQKPVLWWHRGTRYERVPATLTTTGVVQVREGLDDFAAYGFVPGQPLDVALEVAGSDERAQAKVVPFPIEAQGEGGCSASVELQSETGQFFQAFLRGFVAGESVHVEDRLGTKVISAELVASAQGELQLAVRFAPSDDGEAVLTATGSRGSVTLTHGVGKSALDAR